jgi:hypothetical protein
LFQLLAALFESLDDLPLQCLFSFHVEQNRIELLLMRLELIVGVDRLLHLLP